MIANDIMFRNGCNDVVLCQTATPLIRSVTPAYVQIRLRCISSRSGRIGAGHQTITVRLKSHARNALTSCSADLRKAPDIPSPALDTKHVEIVIARAEA